MKKQLIAAIIVLVIASFACSLQNFQMETIDNQMVPIFEPLPNNTNETRLVFNMTGGEFNLSPGAEGLVNGTIAYNVEQWKPEFTRRDNYLEIDQVDPFQISGIPTGDVINTWDLTLTNALPLDISIEGGASENNFDFTGLQLSNLKIRQGASDTTITFDAPNPVAMEELTFTTGASSAKLYGLGNANFGRMRMSSGAGDYTLDFGGNLTQDATVDIKAGISNITIIIPVGMKAVVNNEGTVNNVNTRGTWLVTDDTYTTMQEGLTLTINLDMAVGNVNLVHED